MAKDVSNAASSPTSVLEQPRTKLIATLGPASDSPEMMRQLISAGVDLFRLNLAHGNIETHQRSIGQIRTAAELCKRTVGVLVDLAGPKIRLGQLSADPLELSVGARLSFVRGERTENPEELTCGYARLIDELRVGDEVALADGIAKLVVTETTHSRAICEVIEGGKIRSRQGINLPATQLSVPAMSEADREHAVWAAKNGVDFISLSFVRSADEVSQLKQIIETVGTEAQVIAKIEKREALDNLDEIVAVTDAVMVARGDLGVEIAIEKTPLAQKRIIRTCLELGKPVIVATQMLESMHHARRPTRAEVSDVANAILDGADACMLSGETAIGEFPLDAVRMMKKIMRETEQMLRYRASRMSSKESESGWGVVESVMLGAAQIARRLDAKMVVIASTNPEPARVKSKQRDFVPTVCLSESVEAARKMSLYWGIIPVRIQALDCVDQLPELALRWAREKANLVPGDRFVLVADNQFLPGVHDTVMVVEID